MYEVIFLDVGIADHDYPLRRSFRVLIVLHSFFNYHSSLTNNTFDYLIELILIILMSSYRCLLLFWTERKRALFLILEYQEKPRFKTKCCEKDL